MPGLSSAVVRAGHGLSGWRHDRRAGGRPDRRRVGAGGEGNEISFHCRLWKSRTFACADGCLTHSMCAFAERLTAEPSGAQCSNTNSKVSLQPFCKRPRGGIVAFGDLGSPQAARMARRPHRRRVSTSSPPPAGYAALAAAHTPSSTLRPIRLTCGSTTILPSNCKHPALQRCNACAERSVRRFPICASGRLSRGVAVLVAEARTTNRPSTTSSATSTPPHLQTNTDNGRGARSSCV